jgi:hypothetical protein
MSTASIRIGGAAGFWGDAALATSQLLAAGGLDYLVYDYLAEITMSIMARARAADPARGYATDFISSAMAPNLEAIAGQGVKVLANAGGVNPEACAAALRGEIAARGLDLRVAVVLGDDLTERAAEFAGQREMFSGEAFPPAEAIASINAYLGAFPLARALSDGADIVITGRCVDSAVTLAACIHAFGWEREDLDRLAQGSLAGPPARVRYAGHGRQFHGLGDRRGHASRCRLPDRRGGGERRFVITKPAEALVAWSAVAPWASRCSTRSVTPGLRVTGRHLRFFPRGARRGLAPDRVRV